ncbi:MAG: acylphosphatase [Bacteroidota bacterium]|nr:acylphosphatase [Bacteroidota bacterium]
MKRHYNITVRGRVQGVGFRYNARRQAMTLGLDGFVKNMPDGSVYMEVEGNQVDLDEFVYWCHTGPSYSRVLDVIVSISNLEGFTGFSAY